jgi:4-diphosphocytidyl-2-C-methyl-D-erythritol kinase
LQELVDANVDSARSGGASAEAARAKINLALHVGSRRGDGYHAIDSLVTFADLADVVRAIPSSEGRLGLKVDGSFGDQLASSRSSENLVLRAAEAISGEARDRSLSFTELILTKNIPVAAGLGGGSADAAATLRLLNRHWDLGLENDRLAEIGVTLGADVPMCLFSCPAIARGIGERLTDAGALPSLPLVLVRPDVALSTAEVYGRLEERERPPLPPLPSRFVSIAAFASWLRKTRNDLVEPAGSLTGLVYTAITALSSDPGCLFARMSGSGASVFGIFPTFASAKGAATRILSRQPNWWVTAVETIGS